MTCSAARSLRRVSKKSKSQSRNGGSNRCLQGTAVPRESGRGGEGNGKIPRRRTEECLEKKTGVGAKVEKPLKLEEREKSIRPGPSLLCPAYESQRGNIKLRASLLATHSQSLYTPLTPGQSGPDPFMAGERCRGGPESKSPPSLLFSGRENGLLEGTVRERE